MTHPPLAIRSLVDGWTLHAPTVDLVPESLRGREITASVPGCVHTDLLAADLIPDPYLDDNEALLAWIGRVDWTYSTSFEWTSDGHDRHDLVFDGLDTVAVVEINGQVVAETANQHRSYRIALDGVVREGANELTVRFRAPVPYATEQSLVLGARPRPYPLPYEAIRKSACSFGWDWGIATFTSGIWRGVRVESWSGARLTDVRVDTEVEGAGGVVNAHVRVERSGTDRSDLTVDLTVDGVGVTAAIPADSDEATVSLALDEVQRWWPVGYGEARLYEAEVHLRADAAIDTVRRRVGFRSVRWDTTPDADGTPFTLVVNDQPVFVKGVNWIPDDAFPVRVDRARYERRLRQAVHANVNLIRVWGGGIYESDDFYELCDELGLLSWQDFLFACAAYPEEEPLRSEIEAEARENIVRLASHPSLVLFTGNNENLWGFEDWDWQRRLDGRSWGAYYYHELFPRLIAELAPHVPYAPGSPFSPGGEHPNAEEHGSMHLWEQWNRQDYLTYREHRPRFVAEFGWQGPPTWSTLTRSISDQPLTPESPGMIVHQKAENGNVKLGVGLVPHYRVPDDMETWHWAMQLNQAVAVRTALEHFRSLAPHTMGAVVWQLNDCWPVTSWAAVDGDERPKPLFYALRQAFAPRTVTVQPRPSGLVAIITNDTAEPWQLEVRARRMTFDGATQAEQRESVQVAARGTLEVPLSAELAQAEHADRELVVVDAGPARGTWFFAEGRDSALRRADFALSLRPVLGGSELTITASVLLREVTVLIDKIAPDATADEALLTLLPGESATIRVRHVGELRVEDLETPGVVRSANELVRR